ncbi:MAG: hypothetical protein ABL921_34555, partial [Pirellula sp.]
MLKKILKKYEKEGWPGINTAIRSRIAQVRAVHPIEDALRNLQKCDSVCLVQIGAFIGATDNDPIYRFLQNTRNSKIKLQAVLVEPVKEFFEKLKQNYDGVSGVSFENVAIAQTCGPQKFY